MSAHKKAPTMLRPCASPKRHRLKSRLLLFIILPQICTGFRRPPPQSELSWEIHDSPENESQIPWNPTDRSLFEEQTSDTTDAKSPEEHLVKSLPYLEDGAFPTNHYAGHVPISHTEDRGKLFYWLFEPPFTPAPADVPLVIWLNGGPACSSMDGLFIENGPFRFEVNSEKEWELKVNPHSWHTIPAFVLYVDQPVGTGLSFTRNERYCRNDEEVNEDFYGFLINFLKLHGNQFVGEDGRMVRPLYFSGESHAGHYIPSMMDYILRKNQEDPKVWIHLGGAAIGNGWVDPYNQYAGATAAYGMGLIGLSQWIDLNKLEEECHRDMREGSLDSPVCYSLMDKIVSDSTGQENNDLLVSPYDMAMWESSTKSRKFPPGHTIVEAYLGGLKANSKRSESVPPMGDDVTSAVLKAIHATQATKAGLFYQECSDPPYYALKHQDGKGVIPELVRVLEVDNNNLQILFFNGVRDLMCNHAGNEQFLANLPWPHKEEWALAKRFAWFAGMNGPPKGYIKIWKNLFFLKVLDSGHMVPMDQPQVALNMMRTFIMKGSFKDGQQLNLGKSIPTEKKECASCPTCPAQQEIIQEPCPECPFIQPSDFDVFQDEQFAPLAQNSNKHEVMLDPKPISWFFIGRAWLAVIFTTLVLMCLFLSKRRGPFLSRNIIYQSVEMRYRDDDIAGNSAVI